jgi:hypothetical protein
MSPVVSGTWDLHIDGRDHNLARGQRFELPRRRIRDILSAVDLDPPTDLDLSAYQFVLEQTNREQTKV